MLKQLQYQFLDQILNNENSSFSDQIIDDGEISKQDRIDIYSNAYRLRLKQCIETDHPVLGIYLGDDLFDKMVAGYIEAFPSHNTSLRYFSDNLPHFLQSHQPFKNSPIISELARFERLLLSAFDAAELETSRMEHMSLIAADNWPTLKFKLHPSTNVFTTQFNTVEIWQAIKQKSDVPRAVKSEASNWLIWRNAERLTEFKSITAIETELITFISNNKAFSDICEMLSEFYSEDKIEAAILNHLISLIQNQLIRFDTPLIGKQAL